MKILILLIQLKEGINFVLKTYKWSTDQLYCFLQVQMFHVLKRAFCKNIYKFFLTASINFLLYHNSKVIFFSISFMFINIRIKMILATRGIHKFDSLISY